MRRWNEIMQRNEVLKWKHDTNVIMKWNEMKWNDLLTSPHRLWHFTSVQVISCFIPKTLLTNMPLWIVSLEIEQGIQPSELWRTTERFAATRRFKTLLTYLEQTGKVITSQDVSCQPDIEGVERQGCRAIGARKPYTGLNFGDGGIPFVGSLPGTCYLLSCANALVHTVDALTCSMLATARCSFLKTNFSETRAAERTRCIIHGWERAEHVSK